MKENTVHELWDMIAEKMQKNAKKMKESYRETKKYTKLLTNLLVKVGYENYKAVSQEYWPKVDISYFDSETEKNWAPWAREVAIEIENDSMDYEKELDKLIAINAGIKVLISYDDRTDDQIFEYLKIDFFKIYKSRKYHQLNDNYILVFGPTSLDENNSRKDFSAFYFNGNEVSLMKRNPILLGPGSK